MSFSQVVWGVIGLLTLIGLLGWLRWEWKLMQQDVRESKWPYF